MSFLWPFYLWRSSVRISNKSTVNLGLGYAVELDCCQYLLKFNLGLIVNIIKMIMLIQMIHDCDRMVEPIRKTTLMKI